MPMLGTGRFDNGAGGKIQSFGRAPLGCAQQRAEGRAAHAER